MSTPERKGPSLSYQALVLLTKRIHEQYGDDAIPTIRDVWYTMGLAHGEKLKKKLVACDFKSAASLLAEMDKGNGSKYEISNRCSHGTSSAGISCDVGLEGAGGSICQAVMSMHQGQLKSMCGCDTEMKILHSLAAGDDYCEVVWCPVVASKE